MAEGLYFMRLMQGGVYAACRGFIFWNAHFKCSRLLIETQHLGCIELQSVFLMDENSCF